MKKTSIIQFGKIGNEMKLFFFLNWPSLIAKWKINMFVRKKMSPSYHTFRKLLILIIKIAN